MNEDKNFTGSYLAHRVKKFFLLNSFIRRLLIIAGCLVCLCAPSNASALDLLFQGPTASKQPEFWDRLPEFIRNQQSVCIDLLALFTAYGAYCKGVAWGQDKKLHLIMINDVRILYDDGKTKNFEEKLDHPDLEDMLSQLYVPGTPQNQLLPNYDPGRFRVEAFFKTIYGATVSEVKGNMAMVQLVDATIGFNSHNKANEALERVGQKLRHLVQQNPGLRAYLSPLGGAFRWRPIAGTNRPSAHSWAIAIDLNPRYGHYWRWNRNLTERDIINIRRKYPIDIIKIFEEEGFIWGGKWFHFDTMHFEYRPELLKKVQLVSELSKGRNLKDIFISQIKRSNN